jgi:hypothetical protein
MLLRLLSCPKEGPLLLGAAALLALPDVPASAAALLALLSPVQAGVATSAVLTRGVAQS